MTFPPNKYKFNYKLESEFPSTSPEPKKKPNEVFGCKTPIEIYRKCFLWTHILNLREPVWTKIVLIITREPAYPKYRKYSNSLTVKIKSKPKND